MTPEDLTRVHDRLDEVIKNQTTMAIDIQKIKTTLELTPKPEKRPCSFFEAHIEEHRKTKTLWQTPLVSTIFDLVRMALVAFFTWLWTRKN